MNLFEKINGTLNASESSIINALNELQNTSPPTVVALHAIFGTLLNDIKNLTLAHYVEECTHLKKLVGEYSEHTYVPHKTIIDYLNYANVTIAEINSRNPTLFAGWLYDPERLRIFKAVTPEHIPDCNYVMEMQFYEWRDQIRWNNASFSIKKPYSSEVYNSTLDAHGDKKYLYDSLICDLVGLSRHYLEITEESVWEPLLKELAVNATTPDKSYVILNQSKKYTDETPLPEGVIASPVTYSFATDVLNDLTVSLYHGAYDFKSACYDATIKKGGIIRFDLKNDLDGDVVNSLYVVNYKESVGEASKSIYFKVEDGVATLLCKGNLFTKEGQSKLNIFQILSMSQGKS